MIMRCWTKPDLHQARVLHDKKSGASACHPEPRPELVSGLFRDLGLGFREFRFSSLTMRAELFIFKMKQPHRQWEGDKRIGGFPIRSCSQ